MTDRDSQYAGRADEEEEACSAALEGENGTNGKSGGISSTALCATGAACGGSGDEGGDAGTGLLAGGCSASRGERLSCGPSSYFSSSPL